MEVTKFNSGTHTLDHCTLQRFLYTVAYHVQAQLAATRRHLHISTQSLYTISLNHAGYLQNFAEFNSTAEESLQSSTHFISSQLHSISALKAFYYTHHDDQVRLHTLQSVPEYHCLSNAAIIIMIHHVTKILFLRSERFMHYFKAPSLAGSLILSLRKFRVWKGSAHLLSFKLRKSRSSQDSDSCCY